MAFRHGKDSALLVGGYDLTPWITSGSVPQVFDTAETSHWGTQSKTYIVGQNDATAQFQGLFDWDRTLLDDKMAAITADVAGQPITTCFDGGCVVGRRAVLGRGKRTKYDITAQMSDVVKFTGEFQFDGGGFSGWVLAPNTLTASTTQYGSVDCGALSLNGLVVYAHVMANTNAANTVKVQHSTDGSTWVDLATAQAMAVATAISPAYYIITAAGTVNRYIRAVVTISTGSATVAVSAYRK